MLGINFFQKDYESIIKILCIDMRSTIVYGNDYIKRDFIKAFIVEHFC